MIKITHKFLSKLTDELARPVAQEYFARSLMHNLGKMPIKSGDMLCQAEFEFLFTPYSKEENITGAVIMGASAGIFADILNSANHECGIMPTLFIPELKREGDRILVKGTIEYTTLK